MTNLEKAAKLLEDREFVSAFVTVDGPDEMRKIFSDNGAALSDAEFLAISVGMKKAVGAELSDAELEAVAGGGFDYKFTPSDDGKFVTVTKTGPGYLSRITIKAEDVPRYKAKYGLT